jgi:hypothetical protein
MIQVPLFDLKFLTSLPQPVQEFQIGGTCRLLLAPFLSDDAPQEGLRSNR